MHAHFWTDVQSASSRLSCIDPYLVAAQPTGPGDCPAAHTSTEFRIIFTPTARATTREPEHLPVEAAAHHELVASVQIIGHRQLHIIGAHVHVAQRGYWNTMTGNAECDGA